MSRSQADPQHDRLKEKDALDALRFLQTLDTPDLARGVAKHRTDGHAAAVTAEAIEVHQAQASTHQGRIAVLGPRALPRAT